MPLETVIGTSLNYYLIAFDADGKECDGTQQVSQKVIDILSTQPITDVFLISHGWMGDISSAQKHYKEWIRTMADSHTDIEKIQQIRPEFHPLWIGLHWPSSPWSHEGLKAVVSYDITDNSQQQMIDDYAQSIADTEVTREALRVIFTAAIEYKSAPDTLPLEVSQAYEVLLKEASLISDEEDADGWSQTELLNLDPETVYQNILLEDTQDFSFGFTDTVKSAWDSFLGLPRLVSFWKMKDRARRIGETSGFNFLKKLQQTAAKTVRFHLMGHSFCCIFASATVAGNKQNNTLVRPVNSLVLVQGALSLWSFSAKIPYKNNLVGYFHSIIAQRKVAGAIITTQSKHDSAVKLAYPVAGKLGLFAGQNIDTDVSSPPLPNVGGIGNYGIQGTDLDIINIDMLPLQYSYNFQPQKIYNLESSQYIYDPQANFVMGSHCVIDKPEIAHAVWSAVLSS